MSLEDDRSEEPGFFKRIFQIPCMRKSFLTSISSGLGIGMVHFLFTSNPGRSSHVAFGSFFAITWIAWFHCRYQWSNDRKKLQQMQYAINQKLLIEGSNIEKEIEASAVDT